MSFNSDNSRIFRDALRHQQAVRHQNAVSRHAGQAGVSHEEVQAIQSRRAKTIAADPLLFEVEAAKLRAELDAWASVN